MWYTVVKKIRGLKYRPGMRIYLTTGNRNQLIWHVWKTMITVPADCVKEATQ